MRRFALAVLCLPLLVTVPAGARPFLGSMTARVLTGDVQFAGTHNGVEWNGACAVWAVEQDIVTGRNIYTEVFAGAATATAGSGSPVSGSLECYVQVNGDKILGVVGDSPAGVFVVAGPHPVWDFEAADTDDVKLCADLVMTGVGSRTYCAETTRTQVPPQAVMDPIDTVVGIVDSVLCPVLATLAPGVPGVVDIDSEGDVELLGGLWWDCPPYGA